eukprot:TRINITY_DN61958_c0_g1_i2.p1 TRINITY_DN61958_c0_g1~~TRINITY_DN61958_c0_g1_i2.p1  ORF type:complete len:149 (+),score=16.64 TRINITY_DN61958_c0_g1_i2:9-455(+)
MSPHTVCGDIQPAYNLSKPNKKSGPRQHNPPTPAKQQEEYPILSWENVTHEQLSALPPMTPHIVTYNGGEHPMSLFVEVRRRAKVTVDGYSYLCVGYLGDLGVWQKGDKFFCQVDYGRFVKLGTWAEFPNWNQQLASGEWFKVKWQEK